MSLRLLALLTLSALTSCTLAPRRDAAAPAPLPSLAAARSACLALMQTPDDANAGNRYHAALTRLIRELDTLSPVERLHAVKAVGLTLRIDPTEETGLQRFHLASDLPTDRLERCYSREGLGVPLVAWRPNDGSGPLDALRPAEAITAPLTAVLQKNTDRTWSLHLLSPHLHQDIVFAGRSLPLAANFSAPTAFIVGHAEALRKSGRKGMLNSAKIPRREKLYLIQPYRPGRIPLIMVHGLQSTPVAFANLFNDIANHPSLKDRYQVWHYHYPTGTPVLQNAATFRRILNQTLKQIDPEGDDHATNHLLVIGHSMGGILSHTLTCDSGFHLWDSVIAVRPEKFRGTPDFFQDLTSVFIFKRDPRVRRVIFVAVPHRGSSYADNWIGDLGQQLFRGDEAFHRIFLNLVENHRDQVNPFLLDLVDQGKLSSIRTLSARSPALQALAKIPPAVPFHSIIGQKKPGPKETGSDGIVTYASSHLDGAESELIVPAGHNAFRHPQAVAEIIRILQQHLQDQR